MRSHATIRRSVVFVVTVICAASAALAWPLAPALAHAAYKSSIPAANSVVTTAPTKVSITFVQHLDPSLLNITVYGNKGEVVSTGSAQISPTDPYTATVAMKGDGSDIYRVDWNNKSADDGDTTIGAFVFAVDPSGKSDKVTPTATVAAPSSSGISPWVAVLTGIVGLALGAIITFVVRKRQPDAA
jgi:methionine-rich copper-binding protein CopC